VEGKPLYLQMDARLLLTNVTNVTNVMNAMAMAPMAMEDLACTTGILADQEAGEAVDLSLVPEIQTREPREVTEWTELTEGRSSSRCRCPPKPSLSLLLLISCLLSVPETVLLILCRRRSGT
jgi:hypothetical protein